MYTRMGWIIIVIFAWSEKNWYRKRRKNRPDDKKHDQQVIFTVIEIHKLLLFNAITAIELLYATKATSLGGDHCLSRLPHF